MSYKTSPLSEAKYEAEGKFPGISTCTYEEVGPGDLINTRKGFPACWSSKTRLAIVVSMASDGDIDTFRFWDGKEVPFRVCLDDHVFAGFGRTINEIARP
jgi:hypothetical protein